ncbi:hypothetical protein BX666DRAFT_1986196 [Dichotomocladium elegans]|nr:hypothetical protein BX666DRAFT_1986196 [Dichotomocladium elegans]
MLHLLPFEITLQVLSLVPLESFSAVYQVFPRPVVDEALRSKLHRYPTNSRFFKLVSTNLSELSIPNSINSIDAGIPLELATVDLKNRWVWFYPDLCQNYFRVEDCYVSHGKLIIQHREKRRIISSLWDIRKQLPPARAGTFSGASEFASQIQQAKEITIADRDFILDACLVGPTNLEDTHPQSPIPTTSTVLPANAGSTQPQYPPRPPLRPHHTRKVPRRERSMRIPCGYFMVDRVGLGIQTFLELCTES